MGMAGRWLCPLLLALALGTGAAPLLAQGPAQKRIMGRIERARITPGGVVVSAKLDSGARSCSLHAPQVTTFVREGKRWARFTLAGKKGSPVTIEREVVRTARIKRLGDTPSQRPVVMLGICLGGMLLDVEVNLEDRSNFNYPLLIGRNYMAGRIVIDPELKYTAEPECKP